MVFKKIFALGQMKTEITVNNFSKSKIADNQQENIEKWGRKVSLEIHNFRASPNENLFSFEASEELYQGYIFENNIRSPTSQIKTPDISRGFCLFTPQVRRGHKKRDYLLRTSEAILDDGKPLTK